MSKTATTRVVLSACVLASALVLGIAVWDRNAGEAARTAAPSDLDAPRPIAAHDSVFLEELTWMEIRDAIAAGKTTVLLATGGVEQNGPYLVTGKHNVILRLLTERIARHLGNALIAPIVAFVPEGRIDPPSGHMRYPGTLSLREETFEALLTDIAESLRAHGFRDIVLIGDSGGNQAGMARVADRLGKAWRNGDTGIHYVGAFYDNERFDAWLRERGFREVADDRHDSLRATLLLHLVDPELVRRTARLASGTWSVKGVALTAIDDLDALAGALANHQAEVTAAAIRDAIGRSSQTN